MATNLSINQCTICLNEFIKPKLISCHHSFCLSCLEDYVANVATNGWFKCPLCRTDVEVPTGGVNNFSSNFYIDQPEHVNKSYCVNHDEQKPVELYCNQCFQAVCSKCYITKHNGHDYLDLAIETTKVSVKTDQRDVLKQLNEKVKTYDEQLEMLKFNTLQLDSISKTAKEGVEKKVEELCEEIKKLGEFLLTNIWDVDDREREKITKANVEIQGKKKGLGRYINLLADSSNLHSLVDVLDTLPKAKALLADNSSSVVKIPELCFPIFKTNQEGLNVTEEQLGEFDTTEMIMFKSSFDLESLQEGETLFAVDKHDLGKLSVSLSAEKKKDDENLQLYLRINENDISKKLMSCTIRFTIKLVSYTDSTKSKLLQSNITYKPDALSWGWGSFMEWDKFVDPENGFIDDKKNFQVEATAICTDLKLIE